MSGIVARGEADRRREERDVVDQPREFLELAWRLAQSGRAAVALTELID
jgi:hypothetical protein